MRQAWFSWKKKLSHDCLAMVSRQPHDIPIFTENTCLTTSLRHVYDNTTEKLLHDKYRRDRKNPISTTCLTTSCDNRKIILVWEHVLRQSHDKFAMQWMHCNVYISIFLFLRFDKIVVCFDLTRLVLIFLISFNCY